MRKKLAPFLSGIGTGLCLSVIILTLWGLVLPKQDQIQASIPDQPDQSIADDHKDSPDGSPGAIPSDSEPQNDTQEDSSSSLPSLYKVVDIKFGMTATQISLYLEKEGIIDNASNFHALVVEQRKTQKFLSGKFTLRYGAPYEEILNVLTTLPK